MVLEDKNDATLQGFRKGHWCTLPLSQNFTMTKRFYKENQLWYIDLPEFLEAGLGNKNNLLMVDGADEFLDRISNWGTEVWISVDTEPFAEADYSLISHAFGKNQALLDQVGHAPVGYGMYYSVPEMNGHTLWLCPVTEYVFQGVYPRQIWVKVLQKGGAQN
ncbi:MAG: hypothetical protein RLZZ68_535 [Bacteroidota bacterium]